jgi:hypothetical protein
MDESLLESLLYQQESTTLDFKAQQYPFVKGTAEQKSELLKDILVFANAWRQSDAHILIGVEEAKGGRSIVSGIPPGNHLDDHNVQQFVCSKTNRPVPFSYAPFVTGGVEIGVLTLPLPDQRPFYLIDNFGRLERNVVYILCASDVTGFVVRQAHRLSPVRAKLLPFLLDTELLTWFARQQYAKAPALYARPH